MNLSDLLAGVLRLGLATEDEAAAFADSAPTIRHNGARILYTHEGAAWIRQRMDALPADAQSAALRKAYALARDGAGLHPIFYQTLVPYRARLLAPEVTP